MLNNHAIKNNQVRLWSCCTTKSQPYICSRNGVLGPTGRRRWTSASWATGSGPRSFLCAARCCCCRVAECVPTHGAPESAAQPRGVPWSPSLHRNQLSAGAKREHSCSHIIRICPLCKQTYQSGGTSPPASPCCPAFSLKILTGRSPSRVVRASDGWLAVSQADCPFHSWRTAHRTVFQLGWDPV